MPRDSSTISKLIKYLSSQVGYFNDKEIDEIYQVIENHVTAKRISKIIKKIGDRRVRQLRDEGKFIEKNGHYSIDQCVSAYVEFVEGKYKISESDRSRLERIKADRAEFELKEKKDEYLPIVDAMTVWGKIIEAFRGKILAIPKRTALIIVGCKSVAEAEDILERVIHEALKELSNPDLVDVARGIRKAKQRASQKRKT